MDSSIRWSDISLGEAGRPQLVWGSLQSLRAAKSFYSYALRQIPRHVDTASAHDGNMIGQQLQRNHRQKRRQHVYSVRNINDMIHFFGDFGVTLGSYGDNPPVSRPNF